MNIERRSTRGDTTRDAANSRVIVGHAARFGIVTDVAGQFLEKVMPGAFKRSIRERVDTAFLVNHDPSLIVGRVSNGSLSLQEDSLGLSFKCTAINTKAADDLLECLRTNTLNRCSFGFTVPEGGDRWSFAMDAQGNRRHLRELTDVTLMDCSVVTYPQYDGTDAAIQEEESGLDSKLATLAAVAARGGTPLELRSAIARTLESSRMSPRERELYSAALLLETE